MVSQTYFAGGELDSLEIAGSVTEVTAGAIAGFSRGYTQISSTLSTAAIEAYCVDPADGTRKGFTETWTHFIRNRGNNVSGSPSEIWYNNAGTPVLRFNFTATFVLTVERWTGSAWSTFVSGASVSYNINETFDVYVKIAVSGGRIEAFKTGTSLGFFSGDTSALGDIARLRCQGGGGDVGGLQQIIIANYSTIGHTVRRRNPNAVGANTGFAGVYTDVNEYPNNDTTQNTSDTAGQKVTYPAAALAATAGGSIVKAVAVNFRVRRDSTGPQNANALLREGGVDYASPFNVTAVGLGYSGRGWIWDKDPATAAAWASITPVNSSEFGLASVT